MKYLMFVLLVTVCGDAWSLPDTDAHKVLLGVSQNLNKDLPAIIDSVTRLDSTAPFGRELIYQGTIYKHTKDQIDINKLIPLITKQLKNKFCTSPTMKFWRENNLSWKHDYYDKNGLFVMEIVTSAKNCIKPNNSNQSSITPEMQKWLDRNPWYMKGGQKSDFARTEFDRITADGMSENNRNTYDILDRRIKSQFNSQLDASLSSSSSNTIQDGINNDKYQTVEEKNCMDAKETLNKYKSAPFLFRVDKETNQKIRLSENETQETIFQAEKDISYWCMKSISSSKYNYTNSNSRIYKCGSVFTDQPCFNGRK